MMTSHPLIILRGNSGCGKTSTARLLQRQLGYGTMLVSQDMVRREILHVKDSKNNPAIQLIYDLCMYGNKVGYTVILEGILSSKKYGAMLRQLLNDFQGDSILKNMRYILLLRGINVGGKNKVSMNDLKAKLEDLGYQNVVTYINSGNVIFDTDDDPTTIKDNIAIILGRFPFTIKHVILTKDEYLGEVSNLPEWWHQPLARTDVLFYTDDIDLEYIKERIGQMPLHDEIVHFGKKAVFWGKYSDSLSIGASFQYECGAEYLNTRRHYLHVLEPVQL